MTVRKAKLAAGLMSIAMIATAMPVQASNVQKVLPSAGINYILTDSSTSLNDMKEAAGKKNASVSANDISDNTTGVKGVNTTDKAIEETRKAEVSEEVRNKILKDIEESIAADKEEESFKSLVIAKVNNYVNVRAEGNEEAEIVGKLYDKSVGNFIEETDEGWYKITSGSVTGYVKGEFCVTGDDAVELAKEVGTRIATVTTTTLKVREEPGTDTTVLGLVPIEDELVVTEEMDDWVKVDIEEGCGYVSKDYVTLSTEFVKAESKEEEEARLAKEAAERNAALAAAAKKASGTQATVNYSVSGSGNGTAVANYALQFVGNPYVYGGTSLTNGADCSGFVMSVYKNFGVSLPHSSAADRSVGASVGSLAEAQPGDLICYSGHVALYIGNGQIVHASTSRTGIIVSSASYRNILSIRRIF